MMSKNHTAVAQAVQAAQKIRQQYFGPPGSKGGPAPAPAGGAPSQSGGPGGEQGCSVRVAP
jgi:hypothetical protein